MEPHLPSSCVKTTEVIEVIPVADEDKGFLRAGGRTDMTKQQ